MQRVDAELDRERHQQRGHDVQRREAFEQGADEDQDQDGPEHEQSGAAMQSLERVGPIAAAGCGDGEDEGEGGGGGEDEQDHAGEGGAVDDGLDELAGTHFAVDQHGQCEAVEHGEGRDLGGGGEAEQDAGEEQDGHDQGQDRLDAGAPAWWRRRGAEAGGGAAAAGSEVDERP